MRSKRVGHHAPVVGFLLVSFIMLSSPDWISYMTVCSHPEDDLRFLPGAVAPGYLFVFAPWAERKLSWAVLKILLKGSSAHFTLYACWKTEQKSKPCFLGEYPYTNWLLPKILFLSKRCLHPSIHLSDGSEIFIFKNSWKTDISRQNFKSHKVHYFVSLSLVHVL